MADEIRDIDDSASQDLTGTSLPRKTKALKYLLFAGGVAATGLSYVWWANSQTPKVTDYAEARIDKNESKNQISAGKKQTVQRQKAIQEEDARRQNQAKTTNTSHIDTLAEGQFVCTAEDCEELKTNIKKAAQDFKSQNQTMLAMAQNQQKLENQLADMNQRIEQSRNYNAGGNNSNDPIEEAYKYTDREGNIYLSKRYLEEEKALNNSYFALVDNVEKFDGTVKSYTYSAFKSRSQWNEENAKKNASLVASGTGAKSVPQIVLPTGCNNYITLEMGANTDIGGPVIARIESGQHRGTRLFASGYTAGYEHLQIKFTTFELPDGRTGQLEGYAVNNDGEAGVASSVNNHYISRLTGVVITSALSGWGNSYAEQNSRSTISNGTVIQDKEPMKESDHIKVGIGKAANDAGSIIQEMTTRPKTIKATTGANGFGMGLCITKPGTI